MIECPCVNCIVVPICRHRSFVKILECPLVTNYFGQYELNLRDYYLCRTTTYEALRSTSWQPQQDGDFFKVAIKVGWSL